MNSNSTGRFLSCLTAIVFLQAGLAGAQNLSFLRESPIGWMDEADQAVLTAAVDALLEQPDDTIVDWANPDSTAHGRLKVFETHEDYGTTCRNIKMRIEAKGRKDGGVVRLCKADDGKWKFAPSRPAPYM
jgi:surface antigen